MRLINVEKFIATDILEFEEFFEADVPPYAILSHRWGSQELTFKEVAKRRCDRSKAGYKKVVSACRVTVHYYLAYLWCDTCCINRDSSAELSEAINSMFKWYEKSRICLAYLADVNSTHEDSEGRFRASEWFNRAWTLQELLAPRKVHFFDKFWTDIGSKDDRSALIESITNIPGDLLRGETLLSDYVYAAKLFWASKRVATRTEDIAYSLLGILHVYMTPLHGEEDKAFVRLQEEILRHNGDDLTLLYWDSDVLNGRQRRQCHPRRLLAEDPSCFREVPDGGRHYQRKSFNLIPSNAKLDIEGYFVHWESGVEALLLTGEPMARSDVYPVMLIQQVGGGRRIFKTGIGMISMTAEKAAMCLRPDRRTIFRLPNTISHPSTREAVELTFDESISGTATCYQYREGTIYHPAADFKAEFIARGVRFIYQHPNPDCSVCANIECAIALAHEMIQLYVYMTFDPQGLLCLMFAGAPQLHVVDQLEKKLGFDTRSKYGRLRDFCDSIDKFRDEESYGTYLARNSPLSRSGIILPNHIVTGATVIRIDVGPPWHEDNRTEYWKLVISNGRD